MDEDHLHDDLRTFRDRSFFQQRPRTFLTIYSLLALSFLLIIILFAVSLSRVSALSSRLSEVHAEGKCKRNFSDQDHLLFPCGPDSREWEYFDGKCYFFSLAKMTWPKAKLQCEEMHSQLAVINSFPEQNFVTFRTRNERFWIGLTDRDTEGEWKWVDGTDYKTSFTFWKEGEPNDSGSEDCAHLWVSGKWNDVACSFECFYICEKPLPH